MNINENRHEPPEANKRQTDAELQESGAVRGMPQDSVPTVEDNPVIDEASEESFPASDPPASTHCAGTR